MDEQPRKLKKRQKLCQNCEGEIDLDVIVCPFCAADLRDVKPEQGWLPFSSPTQTSQSLYPPKERPQDVPSPPPEEAAAPEEEHKNIIGPTILFTLGVQLALLGFLMLLFSHKGILMLKWDATWWFVYCVASFPFLYFGYKALSKL